MAFPEKKERNLEWVKLKKDGWGYGRIAKKSNVARTTVVDAIAKYRPQWDSAYKKKQNKVVA